MELHPDEIWVFSLWVCVGTMFDVWLCVLGSDFGAFGG